jgi:hypothetical protein
MIDMRYIVAKQMEAERAYHEHLASSPNAGNVPELQARCDRWERALTAARALCMMVREAEAADEASGRPADGAGFPDAT